MNICDFFSIPPIGIAVILNEEDKEFAILSSVNMMTNLFNELKYLKEGTHRSKRLIETCHKLTFKFLEEMPQPINGDLTRLYGTHVIWENRYRAMGYKDVSERKIRKAYFQRVSVDLFYDVNNTPYAMVYLIRTNDSRYIIGVFETLEEAEIWRDANYSSQCMVEYKVATNELTDRYMANLQTDPDLNCFIRVTDPKVRRVLREELKATREEKRKQKLEKKD